MVAALIEKKETNEKWENGETYISTISGWLGGSCIVGGTAEGCRIHLRQSG